MGTPTPVPPLLGREAEIRALGEALDEVASGRPATVLIEGEAGIGKTRLLDHALEDARARGMQVVAGRAEELERTRPFGPLAAAFECTSSSPDPRRAAIAGLLGAQGGGDSGPITVTSDPGLRFRAVDAFADLAEELALDRMLVIGLDDLQWADPSSLLTIGALVRRLAFLPLALVGCFRPAPRVADLERLASALEAAGARPLILGPLTGADVRDLVADTVAAEPGPGLLAEVSGAAGNPLFVTELLGALLAEGGIKTAGGRAEVAEATLPPTLRLTILRRLSFLPEDTLQVLRAASVLGSGFSLTGLGAVTGQPAVELSAALAEAIRARVIDDDGTRLRFRHDLIRDSIYADLPASMRSVLHREAGQRLAQAGAPALQVAEHLARGATTGDAEAIAWLTGAAREAAATSPDVAADLLEQATGLMRSTDPGQDRLLVEQASSLMWAGRIPDAQMICRALLDRDHDPGAEGPARICLGYALIAEGHGREGLTELERADESPVLSDAERADTRAWASLARLSLGDLDGASAAAEQARPTAVSAGNHQAISVAMATLALVCEHRGQLRDAVRVIDDAVRLADQSPARQGHRYPVHIDRAFILAGLDRLDEARSTLSTGRRIGEELGIRWPLPTYHVARAVERFIAGEWDDAIAEVEASAELADEAGQSYRFMLGRSVLSLISLHRNDLNRAAEAAASAVGQAAEARSRGRVWATWAHALLLEANGRIADARTALAEGCDQCARLGLAMAIPVFGPDLVRLALAAGDTQRARQVSAAVTDVAARNDVASLTGAALRCRGLAEDDAGSLLAAAEAYQRASRPFERALAAEDAGTVFARQGTAGRARVPLEQAIEIYERLGAARDLVRAEAVLRQAGIRRGRRGTRGRPQAGWHSLTPTEHTIAALVAEGLSNPQIGTRLYISRRTVQTHLAHVFAKLGIASRAQLAAEVTQHRDSQPESTPSTLRA